jgi:O-antigen/teichoic acid export membrane protein
MSRNVANNAVRNIFFSGVRLAITAGSTICISAILARTLGPQNMGLYSYAMWIVGTLGILANIGLPSALTKYISEYIGTGDTATAVRVGKRLLLTQLIVAASVSVLTACFWFLKTPYRSIIILAAVMILLQALQQGLIAALAGFQRFDKIALISLCGSLVQVASVATAARLHAGVIGMLGATLAGQVAGTLLSYYAIDGLLKNLSAQASISLPKPLDTFSRIRKFSITISYVLLLDTIVWQRSEVLFLKWYSTLPQIAFYALAFSIATKLNEISGTFAGTLLPIYSESYGRHGMREVGSVFEKALKYVQMVMVFPCLVGTAICRPLVELLYGPNYGPVVLPLQLLLVSIAFTSMGVANSPLLVGTEKQSFIAKYGTFVAFLNITLDFCLIPRYGALGAAIANCSAQIAGVLGGTFYVIHFTRARFPWSSTAKIYFSAAAAVAPVAYCFFWVQPGIPMRAASVAVGATLYFGLLVVTGELGMDDFNVLKGAFLTKVHSSKRQEVPDVA